ncbi:MAG: GDP-mannose 4,6-dehydratase [Thermoanaerobaculia bacterium]
MRVLVTGASGFVGSRLMGRLADAGHDPWGTTFDAAETPPAVGRWVALDLRAPDDVARVVEEVGAEAIVHLGGLSHVGRSWSAIGEYFRTNVLGTRNLLTAAGAARVIVASSAEVYGAVPDAEQPIVESREPMPQSPYAMTKAAGELLAVPKGAIVVRPFNLVGPGQSVDFALPAFARQLALIREGRKEPVLAVGNLAARRDFLHVDDAIEAYLSLLEEGRPGEIYNLGSGRAWSIEAALRRLMELSGVEANVEVDPERLRPVDVPQLCADCSRLWALGWRPERSLDGALKDLWEETLRHVSATEPAEAS